MLQKTTASFNYCFEKHVTEYLRRICNTLFKNDFSAVKKVLKTGYRITEKSSILHIPENQLKLRCRGSNSANR